MTTATSSRRFTGDFRADVLVAIVVAVALIGGYAYWQSLAGQTVQVTDSFSGFSIKIPNHWTVEQDPSSDTFINAYDSRADSSYKTSISGQSFAIDTENPATLNDIVDRLIQQRGDELMAFHLLDDQPTTIAGAEARAISYAYVTRPIDDPFSDAPPVVVITTDYVIYTANEYWVVTLVADEKIADHEQRDFNNILSSITLP